MSDDDRRRADAEGTDGTWTAGIDPTVPRLCERCWFPILPGQAARREPVHVSGSRFTARLVCFVHAAPECTPQDGDDEGSGAEAA